MNNALLSVKSAWLCAAELDVEHEEEERIEAAARQKKQQIKGKYEVADAAARLDMELQHQKLEWKKKAVMRQQRILTRDQQEELQMSSHHQKNEAMNKKNVYAVENLRLAMLLRDKTLRERVQKKKRRPRIVQDMLMLEKRYAMSASRIQRWWQTYLRRQFWKLYYQKTKAAVQIQRIARGMCCRQWLRIWHINRTYRVTRIQAAFRGYYMRRVVHTWKQWEFVNTVRIQAMMRGYFVRKKYHQLKKHVAALHIQMMWRGVASRRKTDILWLSREAINLQRFVRGILARKMFRRKQIQLNGAATSIQRMFRGMQARVKIDELLRDRETRNRQEFMLVLEAEEEWHRIQRDKLQARLKRLQLREQVSELEDEYFRQHERICDMESIYLDMQTQRMRVSPRAIQDGWVEEMEVKMKQQRALITKMKLVVIFELGLEFKTKELDLLELLERIDDMEEKRQKFQTWRDEEFLDYWERECRYQHERRGIQKHQRVAEQKRRWRIQWYHQNGKHDKRWRGNHWDAQVLEEAKAKETFYLGNANILAFIQEKWKKYMAGGDAAKQNDDTKDRITHLSEQVALVTTSAQMEQTKAIFDPIYQDMERSFQNVQHMQQNHQKRLNHFRKKKKNERTEIGDKPVEIIQDVHKQRDSGDAMSRQQKVRRNIQAAKIPWHLLDQLAAEKRKFEEEKLMFQVWKKPNVTTRRPRDNPRRSEV